MALLRAVRPASVLLGIAADKLTFVAAAVSLALLLGVAHPAFGLLAMALGFGTLALGGFVAARHARSADLLHGLAVGVFGTVVSMSRFIVNTFSPPDEAAALHPLWWELLSWSTAPVAGLLGGWFAQKGRRSSPRDPRPAEASWALWLPVYLAVLALLAFAEQF